MKLVLDESFEEGVGDIQEIDWGEGEGGEDVQALELSFHQKSLYFNSESKLP